MVGTHRDISDRKQAEAALRESEARFRNAFEYAGIGMALVALDGHFLKVNPALCSITGYAEAELLTKSFQDITYVGDLKTDLQYANQLLRGEISSYQMEKRYIHKQGHLVWVMLTGSLVRDESGQPLHFIAQLQDVTARKQIEEALTQSERRFRAIFNQTFQFCGLMTTDGILLEANQTALDFGGLTPSDIIGLPFWEARWWTISPETQRRLQAAIAEASTGRFVRYEVDALGAGDTVATIDFSIKPVRDAYGKVILLIPEGRDITARKQAEQQLREREAQLAEAQRLTHVGHWAFDVITEQIDWSDEIFRIFGLDPDQPEPPLEEHLQQIHPDDRDFWQQTVGRSLKTGESYIFDFRIVLPNGSVRHVEGRGQAVMNTQGRVVRLFGTVQDITERKHLEEQVRSQLLKEQTLNRVVQVIRSTLDLTTVFSSAVQEVKQVLNVDQVAIVQQVPEHPHWRTVADCHSASDAANLVGTNLQPDDAIAVCLNHLQAQYAANPDAHPCSLTTTQPDGKLVVPLKVHSTVWGALILVNPPASVWSETQVSLLTAVADQMAIAIQQSELYQQVQQLNATLAQKVERLGATTDVDSTTKRPA